MKIQFGKRKLRIYEKGGVINYSIEGEGTKIDGLTSSLIVRIKDKLHHLLPKQISEKVISKSFEDPIGKGEKVEIPVIFIDPRQEDFSGVLGSMYLKYYSDTDGKTEYDGEYPLFSIQINLDKNETLPDYKLYGYAPIYARDHGELKLGKSMNSNKISFYSNGWQSWSHNHLNYHGQKTPKIPKWIEFFKLLKYMNENTDPTLLDRYFSEMHSVITNTENLNSLVISFLTHENQFTRILWDDLEKNGDISWLCALSQTDLIPISKLNDGLLQSEIAMLSLVSKPEGYEVLTHMQELTGMLAKVRTTNQSEAGWCSWYYYYEEISEGETLSNLEFFEQNPEIPINLIQLDDGYQTAIGDWGFENNVFNEKFPNGLEWLSNRIHKGNFKSGLWVAPFLAIKDSEILNNHPDWMIRDNNGNLVKAINNWRAINYSLDPSHPKALEHIKKLAETVSKNWGFDYLKIDFIYSAALYGSKYHDRNLSRAQVYRRGIEAIREGFGKEKVILGCGAPLGPSIGVVDAMRIGEDTAATWSIREKITKKISALEEITLKPALRATVQRSYMHNTLFINDPDCVIVRQNKSKLTMDEILLQLTIFGLSGGAVLVSDDEKEVDANRMKLLKKLLPPYSPKRDEPDFVLPIANPLDFSIRRNPKFYSRNIITAFGKGHLVAVINWGNKSQIWNFKLRELISYVEKMKYSKLQRFIVQDYWNDKPIFLGTLNDVVILDPVPKHGCRYLVISPITDSDITFCNSTLHLIPGSPVISKADFENDKLRLKFNQVGQRDGKITFYSEKYKSINVDQFKTICNKFADGISLTVILDSLPKDEITLIFG